MRRIILLISLLLLPAAWALAQYNEVPHDQQSDESSTYSNHHDSERMTVEGCVYGGDGNFTITDQSGQTFQLTGRVGRFDNFVGHRVRLEGRAHFHNDEEPNAMSADQGALPTLRVSQVEHISRNRCDDNR